MQMGLSRTEILRWQVLPDLSFLLKIFLSTTLLVSPNLLKKTLKWKLSEVVKLNPVRDRGTFFGLECHPRFFHSGFYTQPPTIAICFAQVE